MDGCLYLRVCIVQLFRSCCCRSRYNFSSVSFVVLRFFSFFIFLNLFSRVNVLDSVKMIDANCAIFAFCVVVGLCVCVFVIAVVVFFFKLR